MANRYWVGGSGTWDASSTTHWSISSGGASGASVPTSSDSVFFDQAGTYTVTLSGVLTCASFYVSAGTVTFSGTVSLFIYGNLTFSVSGTVFSATTTIVFNNSGVNGIVNITSNGTIFTNATFNVALGATTTLTLANALTVKKLILTSGQLLLNNYTLTLTAASSFFVLTLTGGTLNFGTSGTIILSANAAGVTVSSGSTTVITGTGTIQFSGTTGVFIGSSGAVFNGPNVTVKFNTLTTSGSHTFGTLNNTSTPGTLSIQLVDVITVTNFNVNGTAGNLYTVKSATAGSQCTLSKSSGNVLSSYLSLKDSVATGGAIWRAEYSTDAGNNSGWNITTGGSINVPVDNTNLSATGAVGDVTPSISQTITVGNRGLAGICYRPNALSYSVFTGTSGSVGAYGVSGTGQVGNVFLAFDYKLPVSGVYATGVISNTPLIYWISVDTEQTPNWTSIAT